MNYGINPPSKEVLGLQRAMTVDKIRRAISVGLRVKVRFAKPRNVWFGGKIVRVINDGLQIEILFDDGMREVSTFPDGDIIVDDAENGEHNASAQAFIPPSSSRPEEAPFFDEEGLQRPPVVQKPPSLLDMICHPAFSIGMS